MSSMPIAIKYRVSRRPQRLDVLKHLARSLEIDLGIRRSIQELEKSTAFKSIKNIVGQKDITSLDKVILFTDVPLAAPEDPENLVLNLKLEHSLLWFVGRRMGHRMHTYAQNGDYTPTDKAGLKRLVSEVVDDPGGFVQIDRNSIVLMLWRHSPRENVIADVTLDCRPAILVCYDESPTR